jgi:hypothetical protein
MGICLNFYYIIEFVVMGFNIAIVSLYFVRHEVFMSFQVFFYLYLAFLMHFSDEMQGIFILDHQLEQKITQYS